MAVFFYKWFLTFVLPHTAHMEKEKILYYFLPSITTAQVGIGIAAGAWKPSTYPAGHSMTPRCAEMWLVHGLLVEFTCISIEFHSTELAARE